VELLSKTTERLAAAFEWLRPRPNSAEADLDASGKIRLNVKGLPNDCRETAFACRLDLKEIGLDRGDSPWAPEQRRESKHEPAPPCPGATLATAGGVVVPLPRISRADSLQAASFVPRDKNRGLDKEIGGSRALN
jgi:hypothetical protein